MDIYKQDTESRKFCIKYEKMNDFKNKDENKIFDCSKEQKVYGYHKIMKDYYGCGLQLLINQKWPMDKKFDILFDGSNNTDYSKSCILRMDISISNNINSYNQVNILLKVFREIINNQLHTGYKYLLIYDSVLDKMISFLKPNIMDDINDAKLYKKCMIYKDFINSKLKQQ